MTDTPLAGQFEDYSFAEVAGQIFRGMKTGMLTVTSPKKERQVVFYEGHPVAVLSSDAKEHIARFLAAKGKITKEQAEELQQVAETKEALQSSDILTKELLTWGLKFRFINLCYDLFRWEEGSYAFAEQPPPRDYFLMKVPAPSLVLKGTKHMSPAQLMEKVPGSYRIGPGSLENADVGALGDEEAAFLRDCREGRLVREVLEENSVEVPRARELIFAFTSLGILTLEPEPEEEADFSQDDDGMEPGALPLDVEDGSDAAEELDLGLDDAPAAALEEAADAAPETPDADSTGGEAPAMELDPVQEAPSGTFGEESPADEAPSLELELEPTAAPPVKDTPAGEEPGLEIERHSYGEGPAPGETADGDDTAPPALEAGDARPLDGPPPLELDEDAPALEPPPLDDGLPPPPDEGPGLPPPPWQAQDAVDSDGGHGTGGQSPFAPPGSKEKPKTSRQEKGADHAPQPKKTSGPLAKVITIIALIAAAAVVGTGVWMGWKTLQSPSTPLEPIPQSPSLAGGEKAEGLPVSALPTSVKKAVKKSGGNVSAPAAETPKSGGTTPDVPAAVPETLAMPSAGAGGSGFYRAGYAAYLAGDLDGGAASWLFELKSADESHTIQVEVACEPNTVKNDMERFGADREIFAVPFTYNGRACYRVLLGLFGSEGEAAAVLDSLPPGLKKGLSIRTLKGII